LLTLVSGSDEAFVYDTLKKAKETKRSKEVFAKLESFGLAGILTGAPLGSIIAAKLGLRMPMLLLVVPFTIAALVASTLREPKITKKAKQKKYITILKDGIRFFSKNKILQILTLDMVVILSVGYFMIWLYQPMLKQAGLGIAYFGIVHASFVISQILIINNYRNLENLLRSKKRLLFFTAFVTGIMFIIGGLTTYLPIVLLVIIVGGGFALSRRPLFISYMNKYIPSQKRATVLSTISMFRRLALVIANPIIGMLADWSLNCTLIILGVVALASSFISRIEEEHLID